MPSAKWADEMRLVARKQPRVVEKDGAKKLLARARGMRLYPFLVLSLASGARRGEFLALTWSDVDFESGIMSVAKSLSQTRAGLRVRSTKSGRPGKFAVPANVLNALREHRAQRDGDRAMSGADYQENQLVFCRPEGGHYNPCSMGNRVSALMKSVGLEGVSLHFLKAHACERTTERWHADPDRSEAPGPRQRRYHDVDLRARNRGARARCRENPE